MIEFLWQVNDLRVSEALVFVQLNNGIMQQAR